MDMADVPEHEISVLRALSGYEQMLEMDRIIKQYGSTEAAILALLQPVTHSQQQVAAPSSNGNYHDVPFSPSVKEAPPLPSVATMLDKSNLRFEYDPSKEAAQHRSAVTQAILCPGCGVALGIPDVRPIKVTCPQCFQETVFGA